LSNFTREGTPLRNFVRRVDLQQEFQFTAGQFEHSAQFNRPIQRQMIAFYSTIIEVVTPNPSP